MASTVTNVIEPLDSLASVSDQLELMASDVDVAQLVLEVAGVDVELNVIESVVSADVARTIEGASTLTITIHDQAREILNGRFLEDPDGDLRTVDVEVDNLWFRLVKIDKQADDLTLTFEDRQVARLRAKRGPRRASKKKLNRAEFARTLVRSVRSETIRFYCPELHTRKQITKASKKESQKERDARRGGGFAPGVRLQGKEGTLDKDQLRNATRMLNVADSLKAGERATLALIVACLVEAPDFKNPRTPSADGGNSYGILQAKVGQGYNTLKNALDLEWCGTKFLKGPAFTGGKDGAIALARKNPKWTPGQIAQTIQGSAHPARYDKYLKQAKTILKMWGGSTRGTDTVLRRSAWKVDRGTDYWETIQSLASDVNWRAFMVSGTLYFISEDLLMKSRPRMTINEETPGVTNIDWSWDQGKKVNTSTVSCRIDRWAAPPGTVIELEDSGPATGRWLVQDVQRSLFSAEATITLRKAMKEKNPESATASTSGGGSSRGNSIAEKVLATGKALHKKRYPYVLGGGHGRAGVPSGGGYDCSGGVAAALEGAGIAPSSWQSGVPASGGMATSWGKPGKGKTLTMYANGQHVFLVVTLPGKKAIHLGTGDFGKGWKGFGINPTMHTLSGFTARHWPGT